MKIKTFVVSFCFEARLRGAAWSPLTKGSAFSSRWDLPAVRGKEKPPKPAVA